MKRILFAFLVLLVACTTPAPVGDASSPRDAEAPPPPVTASVEIPAPAPTPDPSWLTEPRPPLLLPPVRQPARKPVLAAAGTRPPIIPPSWTVPAWFIDPANSSGAASDTNTCTTSGAPCLTYAEIAARWGTYSPRLRQNTTITWESSSSGTTDPVYENPYLENSASLINTCTPVQVASVSLSGVVSKIRTGGGSPQLLNATLGGSGAVNQLLINTTHASHAWSYKVVAGTTFSISQPLANLGSPPVAVPFPVTEVDTWANLDTVTLNTVPMINFASILPSVTDNGSNSAVYVNECGAFDPGTNDPLYLNGNVRVIDSLINREIVSMSTGEWSIGGTYFYNADDQGNFFKTTLGASWFAVGGIFSGVGTNLSAVDLDCDLIVNTNAAISGASNAASGNTGPGTIYIETSKTLTTVSGRVFASSFNGCQVPPVLWGPGGITVNAPGHLAVSLASGGTFTGILGISGSIKLGTSTTGCSHTSAAPDVFNCGITISGSNLDAAAGAAGFGQNAFIPGGASIGASTL